MFEEFTSGGVKHQKSFWTAHVHQCLTKVCTPINLCRLHSFAETCETNWFSRGPNGFGSGNVVSDTFVKWLSAVKSASGTGARERVRWEMGLQVGRTGRCSNDGCQGLITTLGEGARCSLTTLGEGALLKSSHWGVAWKRGGTGVGDESVEAAGLGGELQEGTGNHGRLGVGGNGEITLGDSWGGTLGQPGGMVRLGRKAGGGCRRQDSKMSQRLVIASTWETLMGGAAPARSLATT